MLNGSELKEEKVNGTEDGILISWEPRLMYDSYVIDWCNFLMSQHCDLQWERFGPNTSSALIKSGESRIIFLSDACGAILLCCRFYLNLGNPWNIEVCAVQVQFCNSM